MTPAEQRIKDLVERWLTSLELHLKYSALSDEAYAQVQRWPAHERPARWILDLAREKTLQLKALCDISQPLNKEQFAEALELMAFLANLVGAQHIQRFIPLADPQPEQSAAAAAPPPTAPLPVPSPPPAPAVEAADPERTREMPRLKVPARRAPSAAAAVTKPAANGQSSRAPAKAAPAAETAAAPSDKAAEDLSPTKLQANVVSDAIRLLKWGRKWHELAPLIARMAERPAEAEVRKILRQHRAAIEYQLKT